MEKIENVTTLIDFIKYLKQSDCSNVVICDKHSYMLAFIHSHTIEDMEIAPVCIINLMRHNDATILWEKTRMVHPDICCRPAYLKVFLDTNFSNEDIPVDLGCVEHRCKYYGVKAAAPVQIIE